MLQESSLTREKILEEFKDLVKTLRSPNFKDPKVKEKWNQKRENITSSIDLLSGPDQLWLDREYKEWMKQFLLTINQEYVRVQKQ